MNQRKRLGDLLVEYGLITDQQLQQALAEQKESGIKLGDLLITRGYITEQQKIELLEFQLGIPHVQLHRQRLDDQTIHLIDEQLAKKYHVLPLRIQEGKMVVAMSDPLDYYAIDEIRLNTGYPVSPVIAMRDELNRAINKHYSGQQSMMDAIVGMTEETLQNEAADDNAPVVRLINEIIAQAVDLEASDVHLDPQESRVKVRFRVDGMLRTEREYPISMLGLMTSRLKILANLNIAERRLPQDGRFEMMIGAKQIDIRISTLPTIHGEKTVLRILDMLNAHRSIRQLAFSEHNLALFETLISAPYGLILITGPTGSGKTTTLYSALNQLNNDDVNIITVEDPVEYQLAGINQVQVNPSAGLTFANGLRSILRQDPNIVMIGEIRDKETAEMAIRAALTGHLVLSTLHTNNATSAISRLVDMGIEPFLVSSSLRGVIGQRLVRQICAHCQESVEITAEDSALFARYGMDVEKVKVGKGCVNCHTSGFRGRIAIQEVLPVDDQLKRLINQGQAETDYKTHAVEHGFTPMFMDGLHKVAQGLTTLEEVVRVTID
ncbi:type II secretion system protein GspE [Ammoniphilus oxalaticus]|uniref:Type II secretion system protein GspE n=1 Tax=Ammoniphilus oxalaticus TaxID=66863 RepID=A0A419SIS1_9BACL|nr:ATPase, T2SS/T4P/T4SS family [Ammoniphilus oxalaticus]RKD23885.1 type II secretion system protein GspE [Ammoniphilus oxalaticus]